MERTGTARHSLEAHYGAGGVERAPGKERERESLFACESERVSELSEGT